VCNAYENGFWRKGKEARFMAPAKERPATKTIATNREARHEYFVLEALETGVELKGTEVKSLRAGGVNLKDSWVDIEDGELLVKGMHITPYDHGNIFNQDPLRVRRLLAHKTEIRRLHQQCKLQGYTLVPLSLYFKHGRVKMEVGLCKGKKLYDKRADAAKRDAKRSIDRAVKSNGKIY
jgi:SsrA-binding protein